MFYNLLEVLKMYVINPELPEPYKYETDGSVAKLNL